MRQRWWSSVLGFVCGRRSTSCRENKPLQLALRRRTSDQTRTSCLQVFHTNDAKLTINNNGNACGTTRTGN